MINSLYDIFKHWSAKGSVYLYSDPHFGDTESYTLRGLLVENGPSVAQLDQMQVDNINKIVNKQDTLIILGDIGNPELLSKVRGYKVLITGNHDKGTSVYKPYFNEIYTGCLTITDRIILSHEPIENLPPFLFNIHGHDHGGHDFLTYVLKHYKTEVALEDKLNSYIETIKNEKLTKLNVCAEWVAYTPVSLSYLIKSGIFVHIPTIHRNYLNNKA